MSVVLRILGNCIYYDNTPQRLLCRVRVNCVTGEADGPDEIISHGHMADDFAVAADGSVCTAGLNENTVSHVYLNGRRKVNAGNLNPSTVAVATSAAFGRTSKDLNTPYVITPGGHRLLVLFYIALREHIILKYVTMILSIIYILIWLNRSLNWLVKTRQCHQTLLGFCTNGRVRDSISKPRRYQVRQVGRQRLCRANNLPSHLLLHDRER